MHSHDERQSLSVQYALITLINALVLFVICSLSPCSAPPGEFWDVQEAKNDSDGFCHTFGFELINNISPSDVRRMHVAANSCVVHFQLQNWTSEEEETLLPSLAPGLKLIGQDVEPLHINLTKQK